jgi:hypothetical protein
MTDAGERIVHQWLTRPMTLNGRGENRELVAQIATYLAAHPHARDTVEGVRAWWLHGTSASLDQVAAALDRLVALGRMERVQQPSGVTFWCASATGKD